MNKRTQKHTLAPPTTTKNRRKFSCNTPKTQNSQNSRYCFMFHLNFIFVSFFRKLIPTYRRFQWDTSKMGNSTLEFVCFCCYSFIHLFYICLFIFYTLFPLNFIFHARKHNYAHSHTRFQ